MVLRAEGSDEPVLQHQELSAVLAPEAGMDVGMLQVCTMVIKPKLRFLLMPNLMAHTDTQLQVQMLTLMLLLTNCCLAGTLAWAWSASWRHWQEEMKICRRPAWPYCRPF